jgi:hypothetical protein
MRRIWVAGLILAASLTPAAARCTGIPARFLLQNDTVNFDVAVRGSCSHTPHSGGMLVFKSVSVAQRPAHGTLRQQGSFTTAYLAAPGYHGEDAYALRVCGFNRGADGCSTLRYRARIL